MVLLRCKSFHLLLSVPKSIALFTLGTSDALIAVVPKLVREVFAPLLLLPPEPSIPAGTIGLIHC